MEPAKQNVHETQSHGFSDLPESTTSSETGFGPFVCPEATFGSSQQSMLIAEDGLHYLPPDNGNCAAHMLNVEILAHAHTEEALRREALKASNIERHYVHQNIALAAWQVSYQECVQSMEERDQQIAQLKEEIEELQKENRLLREARSWRDIVRPASAQIP